MSSPDMERFWDERAKENAPYFVDDRLDYSEPDLAAFWESGEPAVDEMLDRLGVQIRAEEDVVELGCGIGRLTRVLAARARSVRALDISGEMLKRAREANPSLENVEWMHCDGRTLAGVGDASADGFFSVVVFQHVPDPAITLGYVAEMGRVLRPGGWAAFQVSNDPSIHRPRKQSLMGRLRVLLGRAPRGSDHPAWLGSAVELDDLERTAGSAGMSVERVDGGGTQFCLVLLRRR